MVDLQPAQNPSNAKAISLFRPVSDVEAAPAPAVAPQNPPTGDSSMSSAKPGIIPPDMTSAGEPAATVSEIKIRQTAISYVTVDDDTGEAIGGVAGFQVREPTPDEASLFGLFTDPTLQNSFEMRLTYQRDGATIAGIDLVEKFIRLRHPSWPRRLLGEFSFQPSAGLGTPGQVNLALPGLALLGSAFSGEPLAAAFAPGGEFALAGGLGLNGELGLPPDPSPAEYVRAAAAMSIPPKALFLPAKPGGSIEAGLRDAAIEGAADWILRPQLISYTTIEDLGVVLKDPVPEGLLQAIGDFAAVQGLTDKMTIGEIARNEAVRRRLEQILEKWPAHLSARLLLDLGSRPADAGLSLAGSVKAIDAALQPVIDRYQAQQDGEGVDVAVAKPLTETALRALADLRLKIDMRAKPYLTSVEKTLDAAQTYLSLNNPDSSIGQQRHRELLDRVAEMRLERGRIEPAE